ncbi:TonB-dependent receptor [Methylomonas sp. LL1]|uniref:TonB-dependent receptor n=1 Tax=Methylomonas sp. LL1 TaxID=2785785 RepID=UPI0018C39E7A|nr:TonB-dependent receptor [Methylomonas sp. LL1]QPK64497.1 TonB-dependent receptor [Methylomonas sp. LL1]
MKISFTSQLQLQLFTLWVTSFSTTPIQAEEAVRLENVIVEGISAPGNGLMTPQNSTQATSVVSRPAIEQKNSLNNVYQAMDMLPGVNTYSYDATGLFGGGIRMRGFNSDQIGVSIDGAPMNDAGNFAVFASELVELENLEQIDVIQGGNPTDAPMVGATGGSIGMLTSNPTDQARFRVQQSYGAFDAYKTFLRADTGYLGDQRFKAFVSVSKAEADKFKGYGGADREHLDFKGVLNLSPGNSITGGLLYNELYNNNLRTLTLREIQTLGRYADFGNQPPAHLVGVNGTAQVERVPADNYFDLSLNPYRNYLATLKGRFEPMPNLKFDVDPYYNYGYGTGGNELRTLAESNGSGKIGGGVADINQDGDSRDTVMIYSGALTETQRPGVTARLHSKLANHHLMAGYWYEYAHHRRTQPGVRFDGAGNSADPWLENTSALLLRQDGTPFQGRDFLTENYSQSFFAQDDIKFLNDKLLLSLGFRYTELRRDFYNYASEGFPADYNVKASYARPLPNVGIRYQFTEQQQIFASRAENFKAPPDSVFYGLINGGTAGADGKLTGYRLKSVNIDEEVSTNWDLGYRFSNQDVSFAGTLFYIDYRNRIASAYDPINATSTNYNVGDSTTKGVELESAWRFLPNWSVYGSFSYTHSRMEQNLRTAANSFENTAGKAFPDVPEYLAGAALQYRNGPWSANLSAKYTGRRYSTLVNDESISGYTLVSFDAGYRLPSTGWFRDPMVRFNVYNLLDEDYLNLNAGSGSTFTTRAQGAGGIAPSYYIGAPRSFSVMLSTDF